MTDTSKKEINVPMPYELKALKSAIKKVEKKTKIKVPLPYDLKKFYDHTDHTKKQQLIKRKARTIPFGYKLSENTDFIEPIESELQALQEAKNYLKTCSYREVAQWLHRKTGRYLSHVGLKR